MFFIPFGFYRSLCHLTFFFAIMRKKISLRTSLSSFSLRPTTPPNKIVYDAESVSSKASTSMGNPPHWPRPLVMSDISVHGRRVAASSSPLDLPSVICSGIASSGYTCFSPTSSDCMCRSSLDLEQPSKSSWNCEPFQSQGDYAARMKDPGVYMEAMKDILITTRTARRVSESSQDVQWTTAISRRPLSPTGSTSSTTSSSSRNRKSYIILPEVKAVTVHFPSVKHVPPGYAATGQDAEIGCIPAR